MRGEAVLTIHTEPPNSGNSAVAERSAHVLNEPAASAVDVTPLPALLRAGENDLDDRLP